MTQHSSLIESYLKSGDPQKIELAEAYLKQSGKMVSSDLQEFKESQQEKNFVREYLESGDPHKVALAMEYQEKSNKQKGRSDIGRHAARTAKNVATGVLDIVDIPNYVIRKTSKALGGHDWGSLADRAEKAIDELTDNYTVPTSKGEKIGDSAIRSVATLPGIGWAGKALGTVAKGAKGTKAAKMLERFGQLTGQNIGSSAGSGAAMQYALNEAPDNPLLALGAGLAGGIGGGLGAHKLAKPLRVNTKALEAFKEAEIPYGLVDISKSKFIHQMKDKLPKTFGTQTLMDDYIGSQVNAVEKGLGNLARVAGEGQKEALAVKGAAKKLEDETIKFSRRYGKNEENLKKIANEQVPLKNVKQWLEDLHPDIRKDLENRSSKTKTYLQEILGKEADAIDYNKPLSELFSQLEALENTRSFPYLKRKLSQMGEDIRASDAYGNVKEGELKHLSGLLKKDVEDAIAPQMKALGEDAYQNWKNVGGLYSEFKQQDVPYINKVLNEAIYNPKTKTYSSVGKEHEIFKVLESDLEKGGRSLYRIMEGLNPVEKKSLSQFLLKELGMRQGEFSAHVMDTNFRKLPKPTQKILLNSLSKEEQKRFRSTLEAIHQTKDILKQANYSQSAHHIGSYNDMKDYGEAVKNMTSGHTDKLWKKAADLAVSNAGARLLTSPKVADFVAKHMGKSPKHFNLKRSMMQPILTEMLEDYSVEGKTGEHKKGGSAKNDPFLQSILKETANKGRGGDTELGLITPHTAKILDQLIHQGHRQINPRTGLREYVECGIGGCKREKGHSGEHDYEKQPEDQQLQKQQQYYDSQNQSQQQQQKKQPDLQLVNYRKVPKAERNLYYNSNAKDREQLKKIFDVFYKNRLPKAEKWMIDEKHFPYNEKQTGENCSFHVAKKYDTYLKNKYPDYERLSNEKFDPEAQNLTTLQKHIKKLIQIDPIIKDIALEIGGNKEETFKDSHSLEGINAYDALRMLNYGVEEVGATDDNSYQARLDKMKEQFKKKRPVTVGTETMYGRIPGDHDIIATGMKENNGRREKKHDIRKKFLEAEYQYKNPEKYPTLFQDTPVDLLRDLREVIEKKQEKYKVAPYENKVYVSDSNEKGRISGYIDPQGNILKMKKDDTDYPEKEPFFSLGSEKQFSASHDLDKLQENFKTIQNIPAHIDFKRAIKNPTEISFVDSYRPKKREQGDTSTDYYLFPEE